ncbi:MAG: hypothetical protein E7283_10945 [Lachnospiraceae bacterium]|nr:hypothetical protein [Lachnospiraceae bacterium]
MEEIESRYGSCEVEEKGLSAYGETIVWIYTLEEDRESWLGDTIHGTKLRVIFNLEGRVIGTVESSSGLGG